MVSLKVRIIQIIHTIQIYRSGNRKYPIRLERLKLALGLKMPSILVDPYPDQWNVKTDYVIVSKFSYQWIKDHYITELKSIFGNIELGMK